MASVGREELARDLNHSDNLRVKSDYGNRVLDERRDARIASALVNDTPIQEKTTADRGYQAYRGASSMSSPKYEDALGDLKVMNPETGRTHYLRNHDKFQ